VIVADVPVTPLDVTAPIVGIVPALEKVRLAEVVVPPVSVDMTAKS
jgi:hypothetical protein